MRNAILVSIVTVALVLGAVAVNAGPPLGGLYKSTDGDFDEGREASSWYDAPMDLTPPSFVGDGNVLNAASWDGIALGGDWEILCPTVVNVTLLYDLVFGGNGHRAYLIEYTGGVVTLAGTGPWGGGDALYTANITSYFETRTLQFAGGVMVGSDSDHSVEAQFQGYDHSCLRVIANGVWLGGSPSAKPADYPDYRDSSCTPGPTEGHWGDIRDLTLTIEGCAVSAEESSWGRVKSLYRN